MNPDARTSSQQPKADEPSAGDGKPRNAFWQFSLQSLLLMALVGCVLAAYVRERWAHVAEYRRRIDISRGHDEERDRLRLLQERQQREAKETLRFLTVADKTQVHVKSEPSGYGSRDFGGWAWKIYLPPNNEHWWLYISQGEEWDAHEGKYVDGAVSGSLMKVKGEQTLSGCIVKDREGIAYINMWSEAGCQTARMSDAGYAAFRAGADVMREPAGATEQEVLSPATSPKGRMQLFRWHRALTADETVADETSKNSSAAREYGFSIYVVDESPPRR